MTFRRIAAAAAAAAALSTPPAVGDDVEAALSDAYARLRAAVREEAAAEAALDGRDAAAFAALGGLDRLGRAPPLAFFAHPQGAVGAARAGMAAAAAAADATARAAAMRADLAAAAQARASVATAAAGLDAALRAARGVGGPQGAAAMAGERAAAAAKARSLAGLSSALTGGASAVEPPAPPWPWPVEGAAARDAAAAGPAPPLLVLDAPPFALARAPWIATVRHVGRDPLDPAKVVVALEPSAGSVVLVGGLGAAVVVAGDTLRAGVPYAAAPGPADAGADEFLIDGADEGGTIPSPTIYIAMWRGGVAVDPAPFFAAR